MYLVQVSLILTGQQDLGHFFRYRPLLPIGWRTVHIVRQRRRKMINTAPTTLSLRQAASKSTFINAQLYSTFDKQEYMFKLAWSMNSGVKRRGTRRFCSLWIATRIVFASSYQIRGNDIWEPIRSSLFAEMSIIIGDFAKKWTHMRPPPSHTQRGMQRRLVVNIQKW